MVSNPLSFFCLNIRSPATSRMGNASSSSQETLPAIEHHTRSYGTDQDVQTPRELMNGNGGYENLTRHLMPVRNQNRDQKLRVGNGRQYSSSLSENTNDENRCWNRRVGGGAGNRDERGYESRLRKNFEGENPFYYQYFESGEIGADVVENERVETRGFEVGDSGRMNGCEMKGTGDVEVEREGEEGRDRLSPDERLGIEVWVERCEQASLKEKISLVTGFNKTEQLIHMCFTAQYLMKECRLVIWNTVIHDAASQTIIRTILMHVESTTERNQKVVTRQVDITLNSMEKSSDKIKNPMRPCPRCPHRLSDLWTHKPIPEPELSTSEVPKAEPPSKYVDDEEEEASTTASHPFIKQQPTPSLPQAYLVIASEQRNPREYSQATYKFSEVAEDIVSHDKHKNGGSWWNSPQGKAHKKNCPVCRTLSENSESGCRCNEVEEDPKHDSPKSRGTQLRSSARFADVIFCPNCLRATPKPHKGDSTNEQQGESSKSNGDNEVVGGKNTCLDDGELEFKMCSRCEDGKRRATWDNYQDPLATLIQDLQKEQVDAEHEAWKGFVQETMSQALPLSDRSSEDPAMAKTLDTVLEEDDE